MSNQFRVMVFAYCLYAAASIVRQALEYEIAINEARYDYVQAVFEAAGIK